MLLRFQFLFAFFTFFFKVLDQFFLANIRHHRMGCKCNTGTDEGSFTYAVCRRFDTESGEGRSALVNAAIIPVVLFTATETAVTGLDREAGTIVPFGNSTCVVSGRSFTTYLI